MLREYSEPYCVNVTVCCVGQRLQEYALNENVCSERESNLYDTP